MQNKVLVTPLPIHLNTLHNNIHHTPKGKEKSFDQKARGILLELSRLEHSSNGMIVLFNETQVHLINQIKKGVDDKIIHQKQYYT